MDAYAGVRNIPLVQVLSLLGFSDWKKRKGGKEYYGRCPIHQAKNNQTSFSFTADVFNCFSCHVSGRGAIDMVKAVKGVTFTEAVSFLQTAPTTAGQPGILAAAAAQERPQRLEGELKPYTGKYEKFKVESDWLSKRVPNRNILETYGVFCYDNKARKSAYSGRVMIPVRNEQGVLYGYLGRSTEPSNEPKYLFPKDLPKSRFLFGAYELCSGQVLHPDGTPYQVPVRVLYVVESPFCVLHFASLGLPAVSPFGWSVSQEQVGNLAKIAKGIVYLPDRNKAADCAGAVHCLAKTLWTRLPQLPSGVEDPEQLTLSQIQAL